VNILEFLFFKNNPFDYDLRNEREKSGEIRCGERGA
jgi:hypothetical protein